MLRLSFFLHSLCLEIGDRALDLAAKPAIHSEDTVKIILAYLEYLEWHSARARDEIQGVDPFDIVGIEHADLKDSFGDPERHAPAITPVAMGNPAARDASSCKKSAYLRTALTH